MCILAWPDDIMTSQTQCTTLYEAPIRTFSTIEACNKSAHDKAEMTIKMFVEGGVGFESIQVGCEKIQD